MNLGVFYQAGHKLVACYKAVEQLRKFYPDIPIDLYEDGSDILKVVSDTFNCFYSRIDQSGKNDKYSGRAVVDINSNIKFLERIYHSCKTNLKNTDWIIFYEDDVWCKNVVTRYPKFDLNGALGPLYTPELYDYLKNRFNIKDNSRGTWSHLGSLENYQACGGTIWNREKFIESYEKIDEIDWQYIYKLDSRPCEWADASISFIFQHAGCSVGRWDDWAQYDAKSRGSWFDKTGWTTPMSQQPNVAFLHLYKHFYNYSNDELQLAKNTKVC